MNASSREVRVNASGIVLGLVLLVGTGCAGKGERIDVMMPGKWTGAAVSASTGPRIAVLPFDDQRPMQMYLGQRDHFWGGESYFDLPSGSVSRASALALVDYLNRRGWRASMAATPGADDADVTITGTVTDLSINAKSGFMHTDISAKNSLSFQIKNHSDGTVVRERVSGSATDQVFWFDQEDAQALFSELLESNFQKFMTDVQVSGRAVRLR
jgi:hypothetical protein